MDVPILLDRSSATPLQRQIYLEFRKAILSRRLVPGQRVPSTRALSEALGVSRTTSALAYEQLASEGYLVGTTGSGTCVARSLPDFCLEDEAASKKNWRGVALRLSAYGRTVEAMPRLSAAGGGTLYDFSPGCPSLDGFPMACWLRLLARHSRRAQTEVLDYAPDPQGLGALRESVAAYLRRSRAVKCEADQVIVVSGTQQAIQLVLRLFVDPGETVAMEDPGYLAARRAFQAHGARVLPLPAGDHGLDLSPLEGPGAAACRLVYVTPSHQYPTGTVMDLARRLQLVAWGQRTGTAVLEDDYDSELRFKGRPLPAMQGLDSAGVVLYSGTFSKVLFPAIRLGYLVVPPALAPTVTQAMWTMSREPSSLHQWALNDFILEGHLDRHIRRMRTLYATRREALVESLTRQFGGRVEILGDEGGMHLTALFHTDLADGEVARRAAARGVVLPSMDKLHLGKSPGHRFILGFSGMSPARLREGVKRLAATGL